MTDAGPSARPSFPSTGIDASKLTLTGLEPASGPFSGGTLSVLRGSGFTDDVIVFIGGNMVQPSNTQVQSRNRVSVIIPAGEVGVADVTVKRGDDEATLEGAFTYNALELTPGQGSSSGGTLVELTIGSGGGATFDEDVVIEFDGEACTDLKQLAPAKVRCKTPRHAVGRVDVVARWPGESTRPELKATSAYEYLETLDAETGGLSGDRIKGTLNVAVMNDMGFVIPKALVVVGNDLDTPYRGVTDDRGSIVFSGDDLVGPVTVHASARCYQKGSIVSFDATNATVVLSPAFDLSCQASGEGPARRGALGSMISGQLIFPGVDEFGVNDWSIVPKPRAQEVRVAYVFTSRASADTRNPAPDPMGTTARLTEATAEMGMRGFKYRIFARPAGLAVYALCGIERTDNGQFTPYVMGLARDVVTAPGEENEDVDVNMDIPLDRELSVQLADYPQPTAAGPSEFRVRAHVDLGGEGVIVREVGTRSFDVVRRRVGSDAFRFYGQPPFTRLLADASYEVIAGYYTPDVDVPLTTQRRTGVKQDTTRLEIGNFLGIPRAVAPPTGGMLPDDRKLKFSLDGEPADLIIVDIADGTGFPVWSEILPGDAREVPVPDFSKLEGQSDLAPGFITWTITAVKIDEFEYNRFRYAQLSSRYFTHTAINVLTARR
ncbi:MAG TPA: IPT/TIG domain-containing protein [Polyangiales bacterium]|nr:IPT/TIG domain-containing protein [Polyangiales bacterium]